MGWQTPCSLAQMLQLLMPSILQEGVSGKPFHLTEVWRKERSSLHGYKMAWQNQKWRLAWVFIVIRVGSRSRFLHILWVLWFQSPMGRSTLYPYPWHKGKGRGEGVARLTSCQQLSNIKRWSASRHCSQMITNIPLKWLGKHIQMIVLVVIYIRINSTLEC